jgi:iron complex outermembrane receptor protein
MSNLSLEKSLRLWRVDTSVKAVVNNLFSTEYVTVLSHPMPRRNYELFIKLNF